MPRRRIPATGPPSLDQDHVRGLVQAPSQRLKTQGNNPQQLCLSEATWDQLQPDWKRLAHFSSININLAHLEAVNQPETAVEGGGGDAPARSNHKA